ncbi:Protein kinase domain family protein [Leishmania donovani]|uniref:Protein kinase domain family protein n=1 Tax=Leishmania donovani TaxID=5661 RepID=A0A504XFJ2_LEIDO|nr:Protein kinase domain family protein [Leishmania donovani]
MGGGGVDETRDAHKLKGPQVSTPALIAFTTGLGVCFMGPSGFLPSYIIGFRNGSAAAQVSQAQAIARMMSSASTSVRRLPNTSKAILIGHNSRCERATPCVLRQRQSVAMPRLPELRGRDLSLPTEGWLPLNFSGWYAYFSVQVLVWRLLDYDSAYGPFALAKVQRPLAKAVVEYPPRRRGHTAALRDVVVAAEGMVASSRLGGDTAMMSFSCCKCAKGQEPVFVSVVLQYGSFIGIHRTLRVLSLTMLAAASRSACASSYVAAGLRTVSSTLQLVADAARKFVNDATSEFRGCLLLLRSDYAHAKRSCDFAIAVQSRIKPENARRISVQVITNNFLFGTWVSETGCKSCVVFGRAHFIEFFILLHKRAFPVSSSPGFQYLRVGDCVIVLRAHRRVSAIDPTSAHCIQLRLTRMQEGNTTYYTSHFHEPPMRIVTEAVHCRKCKGYWRYMPQRMGLAHQDGPFASVSDTARSLMDKRAGDATSRRPDPFAPEWLAFASYAGSALKGTEQGLMEGSPATAKNILLCLLYSSDKTIVHPAIAGGEPPVAITFSPPDEPATFWKCRLHKEMNIMLTLKPLNVNQYISSTWQELQTDIMMEGAPDGSLRDATARFGVPTKSLARRYKVDILHGLACQHGGGITHGDAKPYNIFLGADRIGTLEFRGTAVYQSPEAETSHPLTAAFEIYSHRHIFPGDAGGSPAVAFEDFQAACQAPGDCVVVR